MAEMDFAKEIQELSKSHAVLQTEMKNMGLAVRDMKNEIKSMNGMVQQLCMNNIAQKTKVGYSEWGYRIIMVAVVSAVAMKLFGVF